MINKENMYNNMLRMVEVPGISGTESEKMTAYKVEELLREIPYFRDHPENVKLIPLVDDPFERSIVTGFMELNPDCPDTVILTGHYDVVDVEEFGHLQDIAYNVEEITKRINEMPLDEDSQKDFESGEWIFGRGTADMKYGHALCMELMKHYSEEKSIKGNLLYVAVCGEETNSEGMLRAVPFFNQLAEEKGLKYRALLLTECYMMEDQAGDNNRYIHYGASGTIMPMFFFAGESTHGGEPFLGIDPTLMSTQLYHKLEMNTDFCQQSLGETTPPPVCLKMQDLKGTYSASIPLYAVAYYSFITVQLNPDEMNSRLLKLAEASMQDAIRFMDEKAAAYAKLTGEEPIRHRYAPCVKTYRQLYDEVCADYQGDLDADLKAYAKEMQDKKMEMQDIAVSLVKRVYELYKDKKPMIILAFIPPYYPDVYLSKEGEAAAKLMRCCDEIIDYARENFGETLKMKDYYMGISDMCYTGLTEGMNFDNVFENLAGINMIYQFPEEDLKKFKVPGIVLGGYGKDFHKHTERLHKHYNFDVLPYLYIQLIDKLLS